MATAPEKISIKRRRTEEPVGHLFYQSKKQRTTNHVFVRLGSEQTKVIATTEPTNQISTILPTIRTSLPGDEVQDFQRYRQAHSLGGRTPMPETLTPGQLNGRRFHLTRDLSIAVRPTSVGRKNKSILRPHLPTFVERGGEPVSEVQTPHAEPPVDKILRSSNTASGEDELGQILSKESSVQRTHTIPFAKPVSHRPKTGKSINDDPATWDFESDQLADELIALALAMDPEAKAAYEAQSEPKQAHSIDEMQIEHPDEYVYETYIRLQPAASAHLRIDLTLNFGYLIVDDDEEDLWNQYLRDEEDDEDSWDEEDEDSNAEDNPRNEYPDEEVSSGDEYGNNVYKYRRGCSDDEQFDEDET